MWLVLTLILLALPVVAHAADELYVVRNIKVDETAETATVARDKALAIGEKRAWDTLVERLADPQQRRPLPDFSPSDVGDAVRDFWVSEEKSSPVRYIATLNYNFRPDRVRRLLSSRGVRFTATASPPVVLVPVFDTQDRRTLWDDPNPWRQAWQHVTPSLFVPMKVPGGDLTDLASITAEEALAVDQARLADLATRYQATDALLAVASIVTATDGSRQLSVTGTRVAPGSVRVVSDRKYPLDENGPSPELLTQAANAVLQDAELAWRRGTVLETKPSSTMTVAVPIASLEDWIRLGRTLQAVPQMGRIRILSLGRDEAKMSLVYGGSADQLNAALAEAGLQIQPSTEGPPQLVRSNGLPPMMMP